MSPIFVDLDDQVQDVLRPIHGGTGSEVGAGQEQLVVPFVNDGGASLAVGDCVRLGPRLEQTTNAGEVVLGVIAGRYSPTTGLQEAADVGADEVAAVCISGRAMVRVSATVTRGDYLVASATDGQATGTTGGSGGGSFGRALLTTTSGNLAPAMVGGGASGTSGAALFTVNAVISGGGSIPQTGNVMAIRVDFDCTILAATMLAIQSGSAVVDIEKATYSGFPTTSSICASAKPTLSGAQKSEDTTLTGWTTSVNAGDVLLFELDSVATITSVTCALKMRRGH